MKRLSLHIILFLLPVLLFILLFPQDKRQVYASLKDDCTSRAHWMYQRIYESSEPVDIAFMGSSRTINSLKEKVIRTELKGYHLLNYAYCRYGRNLHYRLVKDLIDHKDIKALLLEVRLDENPYSHPVGPYFLESSDLATAYPFFNQNYFKDWSTAFQFRLQMMKEKLWRHEDSLINTNAKFGFFPNLTITEPAIYEREKGERRTKKKEDFKRQLENVYPLHYLRRIASLCADHSVDLYFLYLPSYGVSDKEPHQAEFYKELGQLIVPPDSILENVDLWADPNHMNPTGADKMSQWLGRELKLNINRNCN